MRRPAAATYSFNAVLPGGGSVCSVTVILCLTVDEALNIKTTLYKAAVRTEKCVRRGRTAAQTLFCVTQETNENILKLATHNLNYTIKLAAELQIAFAHYRSFQLYTLKWYLHLSTVVTYTLLYEASNLITTRKLCGWFNFRINYSDIDVESLSHAVVRWFFNHVEMDDVIPPLHWNVWVRSYLFNWILSKCTQTTL
jgi:hypothetical protein